MAMGQVSEMAVRAYKGDNTSAINAILTTDSPTMLADQLTILDQFARRQQHDVQAVVDLKEKYAAQKAPLDTLVAQLTQTEADLAAKKKQIDAEIDRLQKLRLQVYGNGGGGPLRPAPCPSSYPGGAAGIAVKYACAADRQAVRLGRRRPEHVRLLRADARRLGQGRGDAPAQRGKAAPGDRVRQAGRPAPR